MQEVTLTVGVFFDGTGNNAANTRSTLRAFTANHYRLSDPQTSAILEKLAREGAGVSGSGAISYTGYYTNIHWLSERYGRHFSAGSQDAQTALYIDGPGTETGKPDSRRGLAFGVSDTGVVAKTDKAVSLLAGSIQSMLNAIRDAQPDDALIIRHLRFDLFGFSRGAAAARHFANRVQSEDAAVISAIRQGTAGTAFQGAPSGKTRFIGLFDTVAAIGTPANGLDPHSADPGNVKLTLRPGVAEKVFHIVAANECRFNFALNSVKPAWPELALPGAHSDIGGGYLPVMEENLFLTRPAVETVPDNWPDEKSRVYRQAMAQLPALKRAPCLAPLLKTNTVSVSSWSDDRVSQDRYGQMQKRSYAAVTMLGRVVRNDWSRVALHVMLDAAREAGVFFESVDPANTEMILSGDIAALCDKARGMGKALRDGLTPPSFSPDELDIIAKTYIHCAANWNAVALDQNGTLRGGPSLSELTGFINRPDKGWTRTIYTMDGKEMGH